MQISCLFEETRLLSRRSVVEVKLGVYHVVILIELRFVQRFLKSGHGPPALPRFALRDRQIVNNLRRAGESASSFRQQFYSAICVSQRSKEQLRYMQIGAGIIWID